MTEVSFLGDLSLIIIILNSVSNLTKKHFKMALSNWKQKWPFFLSKQRMKNNNLNETKRKVVSRRVYSKDNLISPPMRMVKDRSPCLCCSAQETITAASEGFQWPAAFSEQLSQVCRTARGFVFQQTTVIVLIWGAGRLYNTILSATKYFPANNLQRMHRENCH